MILVFGGYVLYYFLMNFYLLEKALVIFIICMWYSVEAFEDVFAGKYQAVRRLDIGCRIFSIRWLVTISIFYCNEYNL